MKPLIYWVLIMTMAPSLVALANNLQAYDRGQQQSSVATSEEPKGEVDLLIEELAKKNEGVLRHCLEKCDESKETTGQHVSVGEAKNKAQPLYPALARAAHAAGEVVVMVVIDEEGKVIAAQISSGHPLLRSSCLKAARESTFTPTLLEGKPIKVLGTLTYRFISQ
jgi:TonB family protein